MTMDSVLGLIHVVAGGIALVVGPIAMWAPKRAGLHSRLGEAFFLVVSGVCASGGVLAVMHWESRWMFLFIAIGTCAFALLGYVAGKRRWRNWLLAHVTGQGSAYTAMVTAFIVANWDEVSGTQGTEVPLVFLLPMFVGSVAVVWLVHEVHMGRRPKLLPRDGAIGRPGETGAVSQ